MDRTEVDIDRLSTLREGNCPFCGKRTTFFEGDKVTCEPECVRAQKLTAAMVALTKALTSRP